MNWMTVGSSPAVAMAGWFDRILAKSVVPERHPHDEYRRLALRAAASRLAEKLPTEDVDDGVRALGHAAGIVICARRRDLVGLPVILEGVVVAATLVVHFAKRKEQILAIARPAQAVPGCAAVV